MEFANSRLWINVPAGERGTLPEGAGILVANPQFMSEIRRLIRSTVLIAGLLVTASLPSRGTPFISEFLAINDSGLQDEDGDSSDWIEIHNPDAADLNLAGWFLTDNAANLDKWKFPAVVLPAGEYLVVFASNKDRDTAGEDLHTNFRLSGGGEFLALVRPDGITVESSFAPYPPQVPDVAYGLGFAVETETLLAGGHSIFTHVPDGSTGPSLGSDWIQRAYNEGEHGESWTVAASGVGFDATGTLTPLIGTGGNLQSAMLNQNAGAYTRSVFSLGSISGLSGMTLRMHYDDGFVAYLNGEEVARRNAPSSVSSYRDAVLADQPFLYWPFDESGDTDNAKSLVDDVPQNELVARGGATRVASTLTAGGVSLGRAASFDASAGTRFDAADLSPEAPLSMYAIEFWFRVDGTPNRYFSETFSESGSANRPGMIYNYNPGELEIFAGGRTGVPASTGLMASRRGSIPRRHRRRGGLSRRGRDCDGRSQWGIR